MINFCGIFFTSICDLIVYTWYNHKFSYLLWFQYRVPRIFIFYLLSIIAADLFLLSKRMFPNKNVQKKSRYKKVQ